MLSAIRCPALAVSVGWFCACSARTRIGLFTPVSQSESPTFTFPLNAVPVTTSPAPFTVNARSIARRKLCWLACSRFRQLKQMLAQGIHSPTFGCCGDKQFCLSKTVLPQNLLYLAFNLITGTFVQHPNRLCITPPVGVGIHRLAKSPDPGSGASPSSHATTNSA